jgi:hypothetical protein
MRSRRIAPNRSTESLHLLERLQHTVPAAFRRMPWIGRGERSYTDPGDLNVPLRLSCEVLGRDPWLGKAAG